MSWTIKPKGSCRTNKTVTKWYMKRPHFRKDLSMVVKAPDGTYARFSRMRLDEIVEKRWGPLITSGKIIPGRFFLKILGKS
jgi:hypothetical protein